MVSFEGGSASRPVMDDWADRIEAVFRFGTTTAGHGAGTRADSFGVLGRGDAGAEVRAVQERLNAQLGGDDLKVDGHFGPATEAAVLRFQGASGLAKDGEVGPKTHAALFDWHAPEVRPGITPAEDGQDAAHPRSMAEVIDVVFGSGDADYPGVVLGRGDAGAEVRAVQERLNAQLGGDDLKVDGHFGPATEAAVLRFQGASGLAKDGEVGPKTHAALFDWHAPEVRPGTAPAEDGQDAAQEPRDRGWETAVPTSGGDGGVDWNQWMMDKAPDFARETKDAYHEILGKQGEEILKTDARSIFDYSEVRNPLTGGTETAWTINGRPADIEHTFHAFKEFVEGQQLGTLLKETGEKADKALGPAGYVFDALDVGKAVEQDGGFGPHAKEELSGVLGGWAGAAELGAVGGAVAGPPGMVVGAVIGGFGGDALARQIYHDLSESHEPIIPILGLPHSGVEWT